MIHPPHEKINENIIIDYDLCNSPLGIPSRGGSVLEEEQSTGDSFSTIKEGNKKGIEESFMQYISGMSSFTEEAAVYQNPSEDKTQNVQQNPGQSQPPQNTFEPLDRLDYYLKKFKVSVGNYMIKRLNISKLHFYRPKSKEFTAQIKYDLNKKWLDYTVKEILLEFDGKDKKNAKSIRKLEGSKKIAKSVEESNKKKEKIHYVLDLRYEQLIQEYVSSDGRELLGGSSGQGCVSNCSPFTKDLKEIKKEKDKKIFEELGDPRSPKYFCTIMKTYKGNVSKEKKEMN